MIINRNIVWTACKVECPNNTRPVTAVIDSLDGKHTVGAYHKEGKWFEMYTKENIPSDKVICWTDFELPEQYMF